MSAPEFLQRRDALGEGHLSHLDLDRIRLGESGPSPHLETCGRCRQRLMDLSEADGAYLARTFVTQEAQQTLRRARGGRRGGVMIATFAAAAAAFLVLVLPSRDGAERIKGQDSLDVYRKRAEEVAPLQEGEVLRAGDTLRFEVVPAQAGYVVVVGEDGRGEVTPYAPASGDGAFIQAGVRTTLAGAVALDTVLGRERVVAFFCAEPISVERAVLALKTAKPWKGCRVVSRTFEKLR